MNTKNQINSVRQFTTERLQLAIFLHASGRLRFLCCEESGADKIRFVFDDPEHIGDQLELEFDRGATVTGTAIFASQKFLRRKMSEKLNNRRNGEFNHEHSNYLS